MIPSRPMTHERSLPLSLDRNQLLRWSAAWVLALAVGPALAQAETASSRDPEVETHYQAGQRLYKQGKFREATAEFQAALATLDQHAAQPLSSASS